MYTNRKPDWLKFPKFGGPVFAKVSGTLHRLHLNTVCESAKCPNRGECWGEGTATFMILGKVCTRNCRFCAVDSGTPALPDPTEPERVAQAVAELGLKYVVITSVDRDDLDDLGADWFVATVQAVLKQAPDALVEVLTPDFQGRAELVEQVAKSGIAVFAHNVEVVRSLTSKMRDRRSSYETSLEVLRIAKQAVPNLLTKSSVMVGLGESIEELKSTLQDLRSVGVDMITIGQYLQPTRKQVPVVKYYTPSEFRRLGELAASMGFAHVASGPFVRTSYRAGELFVRSLLADRIVEGFGADE